MKPSVRADRLEPARPTVEVVSQYKFRFVNHNPRVCCIVKSQIKVRGAAQYWMTPSLVTGTSGGGALQPAAADALNFPGTGTEPFSICQWCYTTPSASQAFYSVNLNGNPEFYIMTPGGTPGMFFYEVGIATNAII